MLNRIWGLGAHHSIFHEVEISAGKLKTEHQRDVVGTYTWEKHIVMSYSS